MDIVDLEPATRQLAGLIARAGEVERSRPTPCPAYTLGDLIEHVGGMALAFTAAARKVGGPRTEGQPSGDAARLPADWRTRIPRDPKPGTGGRGRRCRDAFRPAGKSRCPGGPV